MAVFLASGPVTAKFAKKNKTVSRTIQIRGSQTLQDLHEAIFDAFDREEEHLYEFQVGGNRLFLFVHSAWNAPPQSKADNALIISA
jgi:hypothetical protein